MSIQIGDKLPSATVYLMGEKGPEAVDSMSLFAGRKVVMFGLPGAFTPTCSAAHLPGYVVHADAFKAKGVDTILCLSVNDAFVMSAWGKAQNAENLVMVADGNAALTKALGLELDASGAGMGLRCRRFALIAEDGVVTALQIEEPKQFAVSGAEAMLALVN
ncbi:MAG: peroxiredoxin [Gammaproteobacteria bacterium]|nr:peroxiredoxin [Gammaproteobacteria bacterium]